MVDAITDLPAIRRSEAGAYGFDEAQVRSAVRRGDLIVPRRGVLVGRHRVEAAAGIRAQHALAIEITLTGLRSGTKAAACLGSAALLHEFSRLGRTPERVRLYREKGGTLRDRQVAILICALPDEHVIAVNGVPVTTPARTVVDLARWVSFRGGVVVADSAMRLGVTRGELEKVARECVRWPGVRKAREVIAFADGLAATPLESISRVAFRALGLPVPELQVTLVRDEWGNPKIIVDFFWPEFRVVGEADGMFKYEDADGVSLRAEKLRQEELEARGYIVVRWTWDDIWRRPEWVAMRLRRAFRGATRRRSA